MIIGAMPVSSIEFPWSIVFVLVAFGIFVGGLIFFHYYRKGRGLNESNQKHPKVK